VIARRAVELGKNVYSFEPLKLPKHGPLTLEAARRRVMIAWPTIDDRDLATLRRSIPQPIRYDDTPILGVVGTSSSQGKFTLQLLLREGLREEGLKVAQIGTEHQSTLFGMEDCFPVGHVVNVELPLENWGEYFDLRYQQFQRDLDPDIIIVGCQGGVVPYGAARLGDNVINAYNVFFQWPMRADSYIVVVNHFDDESLVQDTLDVLRIVGKGRVILLALSTRRKKFLDGFGRRIMVSEEISTEEQSEHLRRLEDRFQLPTVSILAEDTGRRIVDVILKAYAP